MEIAVTDNPQQSRYEARVDGQLAAFAVYVRRPDAIALTHVETLPQFRGKGVGSALVGNVLDAIAAQGARVIPHCPFVADFIRRNPEYAALVADGYRAQV
jgi:hypothetical protein